jgi:hypothetical protein
VLAIRGNFNSVIRGQSFSALTTCSGERRDAARVPPQPIRKMIQ